jgi:hypothetical protein
MSNHITPTPGRIVWYRGADAEIRAAIVTRVHGPFCLNLYVFPLDGMDTDSCVKEDVTHADPDVEPRCFPSWHWMPYQKQQAEKHASDVARAVEPKPASAGARVNWGGAGLDFGTALLALKDGRRVARAGWNGKGMFVYLVPANSYPAQTGAARAHFGAGALVPYNAYLALKGADDTVSTWAPSGSDALAEDWHVIDEVAHAMEAGRRAAIENFGR